MAPRCFLQALFADLLIRPVDGLGDAIGVDDDLVTFR